MTTNTETTPQQLPANLADVALIDVATFAAVGGMSVSWVHAEVAAGRAPQPVIRKPRCTRWRLSQVREFWIAFAEQGSADKNAAQAVVSQANKASRAALAKRAQLTQVGA